MSHNFCTLFDRNYLYKGLALYNSLKNNCFKEFTLWILCMDHATHDLLKRMNLPSVRLISLEEFESPELLKVKKERTSAEYSWTCASNFIWFLLQENKSLETMIYLDADIYFFNDPELLISELKENDVMITEHRYSKEYDQTSTSGKYCVQFMVFKNNDNGLKVLDWWRQACLDWCFGYLDNNRLGDQRYLDDWTARFKRIHELEHLGGGVAPWNVQQYKLLTKDNKVLILHRNNSWPLVFYHFHSFCLISPTSYSGARRYNLSRDVKNLIYQPYFKTLQEAIGSVQEISPDFSFGYKNVNIKERIVSWLFRFNLVKPLFRFLNKKYGKKNKS
jgi:hypothetical protein